MGLTDDNRRDIVIYRIERAFIALEQAKKNVQINCLEVTANRLYYAAHYAVTALLVAYAIPSHSHDGCIALFGLHFVKKNFVSHEMGKLLKHLFTMRQTGDYSDRFGLTEDEVISKIQPTEEFVIKVTDLARQKLGL